ncbi:MAG: hypothetical protein FWG78_00810 [Coriobacteriia bacterium]|nr:hypothetical protein [Coriobacteriia bacterium]
MKRLAIFMTLVGAVLLFGMTGLGATEAGAAFQRVVITGSPHGDTAAEYEVIARVSAHHLPKDAPRLILPVDFDVVEVEYLWSAMSQGVEPEKYAVGPHPDGWGNVYSFSVTDWTGIRLVFRVDEPLYRENDDGDLVSSYSFKVDYALSELVIGFEAPEGMVGTGKDVIFLGESADDVPLYGINVAPARAGQEIVAEVTFTEPEPEVEPGFFATLSAKITDLAREHTVGLIVAVLVGGIVLVAAVALFVVWRSHHER